MALNFQTLRWLGDIEGRLEMIDQRRLPGELVTLECRTPQQLYDAIRTLAVRGAPAIGVAAAYGVCLGMQTAPGQVEAALEHLDRTAAYLAESRPTAVNLFWALDRMKAAARRFVADNPGADVRRFAEVLLAEAHAICDEDKAMCKAIGEHGQRSSVKAGPVDALQCGALATAGQGTATSAYVRSTSAWPQVSCLRGRDAPAAARVPADGMGTHTGRHRCHADL